MALKDKATPLYLRNDKHSFKQKTGPKEGVRGGIEGKKGGIPEVFKGFRRRDPQTASLKSLSEIASGQSVCLCVSRGVRQD